MKQIVILKVGTTFPATGEQFGDFDDWTRAALGDALPVRSVDVEHGEALPAVAQCAGVVITGSHSMVTDELPWSVATEVWLRTLLEAGTPIFGVCYGHQLLAKAAGGEVGYHPQGKEIGTVPIELLPAAQDDVIFADLPSSFLAHVTHSQTVLQLPPGATRLACNAFEPNHAYRLGEFAYGVQFHPEYSAAIMRSYIEQQADALTAAGRDVSAILDGVADTPVAASLLQRFVAMVMHAAD